MLADIVVVLVILLILRLGLKKGIALGLLDLIFVIGYIRFSQPILDMLLRAINQPDLTLHVTTNPLFRYVATTIIGILLLSLLNKILKGFLDITHLSFIDKWLGFAAYGAIAYIIVCVVNILVTQTASLIDHTWADGSFFFSSRFFEYNLVRTWFSG